MPTRVQEAQDPVEVALELHERALALAAAGQLEAARAAVVAALRRMRAAVGGEHPDVANILHLRARIAAARGDVARARRCLREAARIVAALEPGPDISRIHVQVLTSLGHLEREAGRYRRAGRILREAVRLATTRLGDGDVDTAMALNVFGMWCKYTGRFARGRRCYLRALAILRREFGPDHPALAGVYHNLGGLEHERGDFGRGERYARRGVELRRAGGEGSPELAADVAALAVILADQGRLDDAEPRFHEALALFVRLHGDAHLEVAVILHNLAALKAQRGDAREAEALYRRAAALKRAALGDGHPDLALTHHNLAVLLLELGRGEEARPLCAAAREVFTRALASAHPTRRACDELAACLGLAP